MSTRFWTMMAAVLLVAFFGDVALARKWHSKDGKFSVEAELVESSDTEVKLRKTDGKVIAVAIEKLSDEDVKFLKTQKKPAAGSDAKVAPLKFKIFDQELVVDAPVGAKVEMRGEFPVITHGKNFIMSIQPMLDTDLSDFKTQFTTQPEVITLKKTLFDEKEALAYHVTMKAFKQDISVYMVVVTVGDKKFTCSDTSMEEINIKDKRSAKDVELLIQVAKSLKAAS